VGPHVGLFSHLLHSWQGWIWRWGSSPPYRYKLHGNKRREKGRRGGKRRKMNKAGMEVEEKK
jgi:hypothetical protein